jgi:hypothetical protein
VEVLAKDEQAPEIIADLGILPHREGHHLWKVVRDETALVAASLPVYSVVSRRARSTIANSWMSRSSR